MPEETPFANNNTRPVTVVTGPKLLPHLPQIQQDTLGFLMKTAADNGDLTHFSLGKINAYFVNHPDDIRHILQENHRNYSKNTIQYNALAQITGRGLLTNDGDDWLRNRRLAQPAFTHPRMMDLDRVIVPAAQRMLERWEGLAASHQLHI
jgi:cytochrome P450